MIQNYRLDRRKQFRASHQADSHAGAAEDGLDDFAVRIIWDNHAVLDRVTADDAAGGHAEIENRVPGRGKLMDEFLRGCAAVPGARIPFLEDDHATALDALIVGVHGGDDHIGEPHVGDEPAAFLDLQHGFPSVLPFGDADLAGEHARFDAGEGQRFGEREGGADLPAVFPRFDGRGASEVRRALRGGAALVDGREAQVAGQAAGGGPGIHPGQFKSDEREHKVFRPGNVPAVLGIEECRGDPAFVEGGQERGLFGRPVVGIAGAARDQPRHRPARHAPGGLHEHLQFVFVRKAPQDLANVISGQRLECQRQFCFNKSFHKDCLSDFRTTGLLPEAIPARPHAMSPCGPVGGFMDFRGGEC